MGRRPMCSRLRRLRVSEIMKKHTGFAQQSVQVNKLKLRFHEAWAGIRLCSFSLERGRHWVTTH